MQDSKALTFTHFGVRLQERFGVEFTHGVRMELFDLIKQKKAKLIGTEIHNGVKQLVFRTTFRSMRMKFIVSETGDFITCLRLPSEDFYLRQNVIKEQEHHEELQRTDD